MLKSYGFQTDLKRKLSTGNVQETEKGEGRERDKAKERVERQRQKQRRRQIKKNKEEINQQVSEDIYKMYLERVRVRVRVVLMSSAAVLAVERLHIKVKLRVGVKRA